MALDQIDVDRSEKSMTFLEHLEELRWHLVRSIAAIVIGAIVAIVNFRFIFDNVLFAVKQVIPDLCSLLQTE